MVSQPSGAQRVGSRIAIVGPTATGKTALALELAQQIDAEIISGDSMCVYRLMDVGTAKPTVAEQAQVRHHLINVADADEEFSLSMFAELARAAIADIEGRGKRVILAGGTGLYVDTIIGELTLPGQYLDVRAELDREPDTEDNTLQLHRRLVELDPLAASRMEPTNRRRIIRALEVTLGSGAPFSSFGPGLEAAQQAATGWSIIGLDTSRDTLATRIAARYERQMADGFLGEVQGLASQFGASLSRTATQALGYRQLLAHLAGEFPLDVALEAARVATVKFAKRQQRWFRRNPAIQWREISGETSPTRGSGG
jgi:tRNA dimethylallyltransferase